jgi:hypothetical protein
MAFIENQGFNRKGKLLWRNKRVREIQQSDQRKQKNIFDRMVA